MSLVNPPKRPEISDMKNKFKSSRFLSQSLVSLPKKVPPERNGNEKEDISPEILGDWVAPP